MKRKNQKKTNLNEKLLKIEEENEENVTKKNRGVGGKDNWKG